jgi:drug/metabolite transporter (DMT)-like permease
MSLDTRKSINIGFLCAILAAVLFGSISTIAKPTVSSINPILLASLIYLISAITLTPVAQKTKGVTKERKYYFYIIIVSLSGSVAAPILYFSGLEQTTAADTAILSDAEILFTVILALLFFKERLDRVGYFAVILVIGGIIIVTTNISFSEFIFEASLGNVMILLAALFWAFDNNVSRIITQKITNVARIAQIKSAIGGSIVLLLTFLLKIPMQIDVSLIPNIILLGVGGFAASIYFFLNALQRIGTIKTMMIFSLSSIIGLFFAAIFLGEVISMYQIIAMIMIICGIFLIYGRGEKYSDTRILPTV